MGLLIVIVLDVQQLDDGGNWPISSGDKLNHSPIGRG